VPASEHASTPTISCHRIPIATPWHSFWLGLDRCGQTVLASFVEVPWNPCQGCAVGHTCSCGQSAALKRSMHLASYVGTSLRLPELVRRMEARPSMLLELMRTMPASHGPCLFKLRWHWLRLNKYRRWWCYHSDMHTTYRRHDVVRQEHTNRVKHDLDLEKKAICRRRAQRDKRPALASAKICHQPSCNLRTSTCKLLATIGASTRARLTGPLSPWLLVWHPWQTVRWYLALHVMQNQLISCLAGPA
jgi:hypothetical protein